MEAAPGSILVTTKFGPVSVVEAAPGSNLATTKFGPVSIVEAACGSISGTAKLGPVSVVDVLTTEFYCFQDDRKCKVTKILPVVL